MVEVVVLVVLDLLTLGLPLAVVEDEVPFPLDTPVAVELVVVITAVVPVATVVFDVLVGPVDDALVVVVVPCVTAIVVIEPVVRPAL